MKSYFNRFSHHTLSHSDINALPTPSLSLSDLIGESRSNQVANLSNLDYRVKPDNDGFCAGRSMVEMLGVLAIFGVLSVGAIAGYSKAMMKYKLNKQAEQLNTIFNMVERNLYSFENIKESPTSLIPFFIKMGEIPQEMIIPDKSNNIHDAFNTYISINKEYYPNEGGSPVSVYAIYITPELSKQSNNNLEICRNIINIAKERADTLYAIQSYATNSPNPNASYLIGDKYCTGGLKCIRDLTMNDIYDFCTKQIGQPHGGQLVISWHV